MEGAELEEWGWQGATCRPSPTLTSPGPPCILTSAPPHPIAALISSLPASL